MRNLFLLFTLLAGMVWGQEKDTGNRFLVREITKIELSNSEQRDLMVHMLDSISTATNDVELKETISEKISNLNDIHFVDAKSIDLNSLEKSEKKGWNFNYDKFKEITFIKPKNIYGSRFYPYIGVKDNGNMYLRLKASFSGSDWVFVEKIIFLVDGEKIEFKPVSSNRDVSIHATVTENFDTPVDIKIYELLQKIANSQNEVEYRLQGERSVDRVLKEKEKRLIKETLDFFERLKAE